MKYIHLIILIIVSPLLILSQSTDTLFVQADSILIKTINCNDSWRYHPGDDSTWATPGYDDSEWELINSRLEFSDSLNVNWEGIGWFRKIIQIDSTLVDDNIAFAFYHYGASQIFLNGELVHEFGKISSSIDSEEVYQPRRVPIIVNLDSNFVYTVAVRYSNWNAKENLSWYKKWFSQIGFSLNISKSNRLIRTTVLNEGLSFAVNTGISGIFLSLAMLYFLLYLFYQRNKENLYYSFFTFLIAVLFFFSVALRIITTNINLKSIFEIINSSALSFTFVVYLGFLYSIFYKRMPKQFYIFLLLAIVVAILVLTNLSSTYEDMILIGLISLSSVEGLRVIILAMKRKQENSWIIGIGVIVFASFVVSLLILSLGDIQLNSIYGLIFFFMGLLSLPLSMSIYLARNIAVTNKKLEQQLIAVKELSKREIENQKRTAELEINAERERIENERKTKELEEARQLQLSLLPKELPNLTGYDIAVYMKTATEVGGDYYDFQVSEDGTLTTVIGDATGHGLMAGTMVTATKSLFNSFAGNPDILSTLSQMAVSLRKMNFRLLSMCFAIVKIKNNKLKISSAGMPPVLIHRKGSGDVEEIFLRGMPLGSSATYEYELKEVKLNEGDTIFMYSDGFPELFNQDKEMFGYERVKQEIQRVAQNDSQTIIEELNKVIDDWADDKNPDDDITFVVIKIK